MKKIAAIYLSCIVLALAIGGCATKPEQKQSPKIDFSKLQNADTDVLGEAALKQPGGPSYEFFRDQMPPLRYVDANFHHYPVTLSAPASTVKGRFLSNGSSVNTLSRSRSWINETGKPVTILVGDKRDIFGSNLANLDGPRYADGYVPIVQLKYSADGATYAEEAFAPTDPPLAEHGVVLVKLTLMKASGRKYQVRVAKDHDPASTAPVPGVERPENFAVASQDFDEKVEALIEGPELFSMKDNRVTVPDGKVWAATYPRWIINPARGGFIAPLKTGQSAYIAVFTTPVDASFDFKLTPQSYDEQREDCRKTWDELLKRGMMVSTPEKIVNDAWRSEMIGNFMLLHGDEMRYSQGNSYAKLYIGEGGDAVRTALLYGHADDAKKMIPPLFKYTRAGLEFHQASFKLQMLAHYYRLTKDAEFLRSPMMRPMWEKELNVILNGRKTDNGMFPREKYCGDVDTRVFSLNSNSNAWRAIRDMSRVLADIGESDRANQLDQTQKEYRKIILDTLDKAIDRSVNPPFVPIALSGEEQPHQPIWGTTIGSYWNLMIQYVLGSGVFTADSQTATDVLHYIQQNSGLLMGMLRARATPGNFWVSGGRMNDLYGMRYALTLLQRDEADRALVSFYGKLAQGMTRDTFIGCEGSSIAPVDQFGRQMYLPPNSAANSNFLQQLRYMLVQDYDLDDDGREETLRLAFATPRRWLADGGRIRVDRAPTCFGEVTFVIESALKQGYVDAEVTIPNRTPPAKILLRLRLPDNRPIKSAKAGDRDLKIIDGETIDLSGMTGHIAVKAQVAK